jgi:hypothetical protein
MQKFKVAVSRWDNKYSMIMDAENRDELKEKLHKEGYLVLNIDTYFWADLKWEKFLFIVEKEWERKNWVIYWDDIFKVYFKLRHGLWYEVIEFVSEKDKDIYQIEKEKILKQLEEQYELFNQKNKEVQNVVVENQWAKDTIKKEESTLNFHMKKELDDSYKVIDIVLNKLKNIIEWWLFDLSQEEIEKYKVLYNNIIKVKKITNISKIKEVWELALLKIWNLELELVEKSKDKNHKDLLNETNILLWQIWSKNRIIPKNEDLKYIITDFYENYIKGLFEFRQKIKEDALDKESFTYLKTLVLLDKYTLRLKENNKKMLSKFYLFLYPFWENKENLNYLVLKNKVIKQNIALLKSRITWKKIKYTKFANSFSFNDALKTILDIFANIIINIAVLYSIFYVIFLNISYHFKYNLYWVNFEWYHYLLMVLFLFFIFKFSSWLKSLTFNIVFFYFINIFFSVNF